LSRSSSSKAPLLRWCRALVCQRLLQPVPQQAAIGQVGERVVEGQVVNLRLGPDPLADVAEYAHVMRGAALRTSLTALMLSHSGYTSPFLRRFQISPIQMPSAFQRLGHAVIKLRIVATRSQDVRPLADGFFGAVAGDLGECLVDAQNHALCIGDHHALLRLEGRGRNALRFTGLLALRHKVVYGIHQDVNFIAVAGPLFSVHGQLCCVT
jgi:hypothetical protein